MGAVSGFTVQGTASINLCSQLRYISKIYCFYIEFRKSYDVIIAYLVISRQSSTSCLVVFQAKICRR